MLHQNTEAEVINKYNVIQLLQLRSSEDTLADMNIEMQKNEKFIREKAYILEPATKAKDVS